MSKILVFNQIDEISRKNRGGKTLVVVGGCFDILHPGHIKFLEKSKKLGDYLTVFLESDQSVRTLKGEGRPANTQEKRAERLASLATVDFIIMLPIMENKDYDKLVLTIEPDIIATTKGDKNIAHKKRTAKLVGAKLIFSTKMVGGFSTTRLLDKH